MAELRQVMLWDLPGPSLFLRQVELDLDRSGVCVVACPSRDTPEGIEEAFEQTSLNNDLDPLVLSAPALRGGELRRWLAGQLAAPFAAGTEPTVQGLIGDERVGRRRIILNARDIDPAPVVELCDEWVEATSRQNRRLGLIVLVAGPVPPLHAAVGQRWWWGQLRRLDIEVAALRYSDSRGDDPLFIATVAELAGSDLALAERLAGSWNGESQYLHRLLPPDEPDGLSAGDLGPALHSPHEGHLQAWSGGRIEVWEGRVRCRLEYCVDIRVESQSRLLVAQIRALFPGIETDRQRLIAECRAWAPILGLEAGEDFESLEIGRLTYLLNTSRGLPSAADRVKRAARSLTTIRNGLAHREILDKRVLNQRRTSFEALDR